MRFDLLKASLSAPVTVTWEVTYNCNLSCSHCLSGSGRGPQTSLGEAVRIVDELADLGVFQVDIGGGEPLLHPDLFPILERCVSKGLITCLSTNGTLVTEDTARYLADLDVRVQVSLDGATRESNDATRGRDTFNAILRGLELLSRRSLRLAMNVVLTRFNCDEMDRLRVMAEELGVELRVSRLRPSGRGRKAWDTLRPRRDQLVWFKGWLESHPEVLTGDSFFFLGLQERKGSLSGCGAGKLTCCISPKGDVYPCAFLQWDPFLCGNLLQDPLAALWRSAPVFQGIRNGLSPCSGCGQAESCGGGCVAAAYGALGEATAEDPECLVGFPAVETSRTQSR